MLWLGHLKCSHGIGEISRKRGKEIYMYICIAMVAARKGSKKANNSIHYVCMYGIHMAEVAPETPHAANKSLAGIC